MENDIVARAIEEFGTPFYLFDEAVLHQTIEELKGLMPPDAELVYAMKANPFILGALVHDVGRIEVCSPGELRICQQCNIPASKVVVSGVHKDAALMRELVGSGADICRYTVESVAQYDLLESVAREENANIPLLIRLTSGNQFGVDPEDARGLVARALRSPYVELKGIQYFSGTQKTSPKRVQRELDKVDAFLAEVSRETGACFEELEYGAGLPIEYFEPDAQAARRAEFDEAAAVGEMLSRLEFSGHIAIELGRAIAARCGTYATRIVDTKRNKGENYAIVDGGMHQIVYYGHAMALRLPECRIYPERGNEGALPWNIYGSLCTTNDVLAKQLPLSEVKVGDVMLFEKAGAYCMTEGISLFLSRDLPQVLVASPEGDLCCVRERFETFSLNTPK